MRGEGVQYCQIYSCSTKGVLVVPEESHSQYQERTAVRGEVTQHWEIHL